MKSKIVFGSILAAFLVISVAYIAPISVKAVENEVARVKEDIGELANLLTNDDDFRELLENDDLRSIVEDGASLDEYIATIEDIQEFKDITESRKYDSYFNQILDDTDTILSNGDHEEVESNVFYFGIKNNCVDITTEEKQDYVKVDSEGKITVPELPNTGSLEDLIKIIMIIFIGATAGAIAALAIAGVIYVILSVLIAISGTLVALTEAVITGLVIVAIICVGVIAAMVVLEFTISFFQFIRDLIKPDDESPDKTIIDRKYKISKLSTQLKKILEKVLGRITLLRASL